MHMNVELTNEKQRGKRLIRLYPQSDANGRTQQLVPICERRIILADKNYAPPE